MSIETTNKKKALSKFSCHQLYVTRYVGTNLRFGSCGFLPVSSRLSDRRRTPNDAMMSMRALRLARRDSKLANVFCIWRRVANPNVETCALAQDRKWTIALHSNSFFVACFAGGQCLLYQIWTERTDRVAGPTRTNKHEQPGRTHRTIVDDAWEMSEIAGAVWCLRCLYEKYSTRVSLLFFSHLRGEIIVRRVLSPSVWAASIFAKPVLASAATGCVSAFRICPWFV